MSLTKASVLHYWSSRYGINPRVGGRPSFTRNSAGLFTTQEGEVDTAIVNTPRFDWATLNLPNALTERRKVLTLELARTNIVIRAEEFENAAWSKTGGGGATPPVVTANQGIAPDGSLTADKVVFVAPAPGDTSSIAQGGITTVNATNYGGSFYVKAFAAADVGKIMGFRHVAGASYLLVTLISDWQRVPRISTSIATTSDFEISLRPDQGTSTGTVTVLLWGADLELGFVTSYTKTIASSVARATDSLYWNFPPVPQGMMAYVRFVEQGTLVAPGYVFSITDTTGANPRFVVFSSGTAYSTYHHNGTSAVSSALASGSVIGDTVELLAELQSNGVTSLRQSINGAAVTSGASSGANTLAAAWGGQKLLASMSGASVSSAIQFAEIKIVKFADVVSGTAQGRMDELRALELGPNADLL